MTAASAAALVEMVANLTIGKKGYGEIEKLMVSIRDKAHGLRQRYLEGIAEDAAAFDSVIRAVRLPKDTPDRAATVQQAFKDAAISPFELGKDIFVLLQLAEQVVRKDETFVKQMINEIREIEEKAAIVEQNVEYEYRKR